MSSVKAGSASNDVKAIFFNGHQYVLTMSKASLMMGRPFSSKARFVNYDGTLLQEQTIEYGHQVTAYTGSTPTKPQSSDATMQYSFSGWNPTLPQTITQ
jgi:hypothetical protein